MEMRLNPVKIGNEMENCIDFIMEGDWTEAKQEMAIAFEEAFVNVCNYAYPNKDGSVEVSIEKDENKITVSIWDSGIPYDPVTVPLKDIVEDQIGGHGIRLMREYCDMAYERVDGKNHLTMIKYLQ